MSRQHDQHSIPTTKALDTCVACQAGKCIKCLDVIRLAVYAHDTLCNCRKESHEEWLTKGIQAKRAMLEKSKTLSESELNTVSSVDTPAS